jgi:signal transduction histidine kinase
MRTFIYQLRPIIMKEKELGQWVADLCRQFEQASGITVDVDVASAEGDELSPEISIALFRIIQEALSNIYKHAHASRARLSLQFLPDAVRLLIEDDGQGFEVNAVAGPQIAHGHGLVNLQERVQELGGSVDLVSKPGSGTRLITVLPHGGSR